MKIPDAFRVIPERHSDRRGHFYEAFRARELSEAVGHSFSVAQVNCSVSRRNTLRGVHGTVMPPGTAKLATCVRGAVLDVVVDLRTGSPTFGAYDVTELDEATDVSVYLADGLGHAFLTLTEDACVFYLCSAEYQPGTMIEVNPLDPALDLPWNLSEPPLMSDKDRVAPTLAEAAAAGYLPSYKQCQALYRQLRVAGVG
ncbi:dTDP-4-dehydrorhamnose 3,5-epimerase family protein [Kibdelosporangium persicum]|nr:dTDP-4-dehydrorhamnose 3,5-epimerase [Kibdelosporangium persicum]